MDESTGNAASEALQKIQKLIEDGELIMFTPEQAKGLKEVATIWGHIKSVVVLGGALGRGLKWLVMIVAIWAAFKGGLLEWIKSNG